MPLDPNWFYSTLAQSTAAIVGLGGGFLVQRVLQQRNEIAQPRSDLRKYLANRFHNLNGRRASAVLARGQWQAARRDFQDDARAIAALRDRLVPMRFYWLLGVIGAMLAVGTVAPMLYLSSRSEGSRALLLIPFALLALGFFGFIAEELRRLRSAGDLKLESF